MALNRKQRSNKSAARIRHMVGFFALVMLLSCTLVIYQGFQGHRAALNAGKGDAQRLTHILAEHVELTFLGADLALRRAIERQYINSLFGNNLTAYMEQSFRVWLDETPQVVAMVIADNTGAIKVAAHKKSYDDWPDLQKGFAGLPMFEAVRNTDTPWLGRLTTPSGKRLIIICRRYTLLSDEFGGVVVAAVDPEYFVHFYDSVALGAQKYMSLTLPDGTVLASGPANSLASDTLVQDTARNAKRPADADTVMVSTASSSSGMKILASAFLKNIDVQVHVVLDEEDVLAGYRQSLTKDFGFLALFTIFGAVLSLFAVAMARQITRAEDSEETAILASQAKSEFLANMSHELRTPLNAIIGFSEMMNSGYFGPLTPKQRERVHDITLCGSHLLQLISDILEFSKGDAGKLELTEEKVDWAETITDCERMMDGKLRGKHIAFTADVPADAPALWGDKRKIRQVLLNLLSNAIKFTPDGGAIRAGIALDAQGQLILTVADNGIGIAEGDIPKALSVFGQVQNGRSHEGTGLGLPLCKMYAELHGGSLAITSKLGEGTTVRITFPPERTLVAKA